MVPAVIPLAHDDMQMGLALRLCGTNTRLENVLGLLDELAVQVDRVGRDVRVVLAEDKLGRLLVVRLGLLAQLVRLGTVAALVGIVRPRGCLTGLVAEVVVLALSVARWAVIEGCGVCQWAIGDSWRTGDVRRPPRRLPGW